MEFKADLIWRENTAHGIVEQEKGTCYMNIFGKSVGLWTRELHVHLGLFISPFILVFAISAILFNHAYKPWSTSDTQTTTAQVEIRKISRADWKDGNRPDRFYSR